MKQKERFMRQRKMFPLSRKLALMVAFITLSLSAVMILLNYTHYKTEMFAHYEEVAMNIGAVAASDDL